MKRFGAWMLFVPGAVDGKQHYFKHRLPGVRNFSASPVGAADRICLLSEEGRTAVLKRGPQLDVVCLERR